MHRLEAVRLFTEFASTHTGPERDLLQQQWNMHVNPALQNRVWSDEQKQILQLIEDGIENTDPDRLDAARWLGIKGRPGSGKSEAMAHGAVQAAAKGAAVLLLCPTGALLCSYREKIPDNDRIDIETLHSAFVIRREADEVVQYAPPTRLRRYDLIMIDEASQIEDSVFMKMIVAVRELPQRPMVCIAADLKQLRPVGSGGMMATLLAKISTTFAGIGLTDISSNCLGTDFLISAYPDTGSALELDSGGATVARITFDGASTDTVTSGKTGTSYFDGGIADATSTGFTLVLASSPNRATDVYKITLETQAHDTTVSYAIGDTGPAGGMIFMTPEESGDGNYYEVAPKTWYDGSYDPAIEWGDGSTGCTTTLLNTGTAIGTGQANTDLITAVCSGGAAFEAASLTLGGYSDWFLPSIEELNALYQNITSAGLASNETELSNDYYWSSSEIDWTFGDYSPATVVQDFFSCCS